MVLKPVAAKSGNLSIEFEKKRRNEAERRKLWNVMKTEYEERDPKEGFKWHI